MPSRSSDLQIQDRPELVEAWLKDFLHAELLRLGHRHIDLYGRALSGRLDDWGIDSLLSASLASAVYLALDCEASGVLNRVWPGPDWPSWLRFASAAMAAAPAGMQFMSSGSVAAPHAHRHPFNWLVREMQDIAVSLGPIQRIVSMVPAQHIYGFLFSVILPTLLGVPRVDVRGWPAPALARHGRPGDLWVTHPFWLQSFLESVAELPANCTIVSSTQALANDCMRELAQRGAARIFEMYGSSETAGIAWREGPGAFRLLQRWSRQVDGTLLDAYAEGRSITLPDRVQWHDDRCFSVLGRVDRIVKIAGERVDLAAVESHLLQFPGVTAVRVRPNTARVPRLKALVTPAALAAQVDALRAHVRQLSASARPLFWHFQDDQPRSELGKDSDWD
jgi:4-coumarate--CoA ligase (photoactive yellow protein activation family)